MTKTIALINSNNIVVNVIKANSIEWCNNTYNEKCVEVTSDKNKAGIGDIYYPELNNFSKESPGSDYILNQQLIWVLPQNKLEELKTQYAFIKLREERNRLLLNTDKYTSIPDWPHENDTIKQLWINYRQLLRELPANSTPDLDTNGKLVNVTWPIQPSI